MDTSKVIHQAKLNSWADIIRDQQASSLSVTQWCDQHQISKTQFYYWKRQLADQFVESQLPDIVPESLLRFRNPVVQLLKVTQQMKLLPNCPSLKSP